MFTSFLININFSMVFSLLLFCLISYFIIKVLVPDKNLANIPGPKPYPIIGNLNLFFERGVPVNEVFPKLFENLAQTYEKHGLFKFYIGNKPGIVLFDQKFTKSLISSNKNIDRAYIYKFLCDWLGYGLFIGTRTIWKKFRRVYTPAFHNEVLETYLPMINEQSNILVNILRKSIGKPFIDMREPIKKYSLDMFCETALGVSIGAQFGQNTEFTDTMSDMTEIIIKRIFSPWIWPDFIFYRTIAGKKFKSNLNIFHSFIEEIINRKKFAEEQNDINYNNIDSVYGLRKRQRKSILDTLNDNYLNAKILIKNDIFNELAGFLFAGTESVACSLIFTLHILGLNPEIQVRIQNELENIFGNVTERDITWTDLNKMEYLECVIKESLRFYPPGPMIGRNLSEDLILDGCKIKKGTDVLINIDKLHRNPDVFPEPLHFKPERFMEINTKINSYSYLPFSAGPRNCMGQKIGMIQMKMTISKILLNFNILSLDGSDQIETTKQVTLKAISEIRIKIIPKNNFKIEENGTELKAQHTSVGSVQSSANSAANTDANQLSATQTESDQKDCDVQQMNTTLI